MVKPGTLALVDQPRSALDLGLDDLDAVHKHSECEVVPHHPARARYSLGWLDRKAGVRVLGIWNRVLAARVSDLRRQMLPDRAISSSGRSGAAS